MSMLSWRHGALVCLIFLFSFFFPPIQYVCRVCVCMCVHTHLSYGKLCFPVQTPCLSLNRDQCCYLCVCVCACVHTACCAAFYFFLNGILSMKTSDWIKYQGRCTQCDCILLSSLLPPFKQSFNSNRLPKTHLDTALCGTGIHINTLYCTFSITFYKPVSFIIVQSTNVVLQIRIRSVYRQYFLFFSV